MKRSRFFALGILCISFLLFFNIQLIRPNSTQDIRPDSWLTNFIDKPPKVPSSSVFTFLCEVITQKPDTLTNTCGDFGEMIYNINWKTWDISGATGSGIYSINRCEPNCAEGNRDEMSVEISLDRVTFDGSRYFLNILTILSPDVLKSDGIYALWDLSSFYREVPEMRG